MGGPLECKEAQTRAVSRVFPTCVGEIQSSMSPCLSGADFMFSVMVWMEIKISICMCGFAVDVDQEFSAIARDESVKKG